MEILQVQGNARLASSGFDTNQNAMSGYQYGSSQVATSQAGSQPNAATGMLFGSTNISGQQVSEYEAHRPQEQ